MKSYSAGLLAYRLSDTGPEVLLVHPGGPFYVKKDDGHWSIPKGLYADGEEAFQAARREFQEETGFSPPTKDYLDLGNIQRTDGKDIIVWAFEGDFDESTLTSNDFEIEWPPHSGKRQEFPEVDRGGWFTLAEARRKLHPAQVVFLERLANQLHVQFGPEESGGDGQATLF